MEKDSDYNITSVIAEYKTSLVAEHERIREYTSRPGEHVLLADRYVDPLIIQRHRKKKEKEKEIRSRGEDFHHARTHHTDHHITVDKLFSQEDSPNSVRPKAVILQGNSGNGKSFTAQKILYDWANGNLFAGIFDIVFHLRCSDLNDIARDVNLVELLNCSEEMAQILKKTPERVLFLLDGFDELRLSLPKKPLPVKADIKAEPGAVLSSLLRGFILKESFLLVTTRSIAAEKLGKLLKFPQRFTEIMGFSENGIQQYFQKFFEHDERSRQVYEEVKANGTLYSVCSSPVMCWLVCSVFKEKSKTSKKMTRGFRGTTSIFIDFVFILLEHHCQGLTESQQHDLLKDLGQLAHEGILEGRVLFQRNKVPETILNVLDSTNIPFLCTFHCKDRINMKEMFSFMHLSFQEFFAALLYTFLDETEAKTEIEKLLSFSVLACCSLHGCQERASALLRYLPAQLVMVNLYISSSSSHLPFWFSEGHQLLQGGMLEVKDQPYRCQRGCYLCMLEIWCLALTSEHPWAGLPSLVPASSLAAPPRPCRQVLVASHHLGIFMLPSRLALLFKVDSLKGKDEEDIWSLSFGDHLE
ncbi:NACHT, LRR and PYD domains-containing protein 1 homolog [Colossoma macropomum]|uniref:NACHT, LRR and PYD domains-containing protein 1 homolog n=1 Tax=Colossoma macropomum TaxID=42526 RepID=UPI0018642FB2|nr:NACHT, LRR and PYD domains-containing protein 1 homolog [Colossoma macropomum]